MNCNFSPFPMMETARLQLKQMTETDSRAIFAYQSNKENFPFVDMPVYKDMSQASAYIQKMNAGVADNRWIIWGIYLKDSGAMVGTISIWNLSHETDTAEVGYNLFPAHRGNGYMAEALPAVCTFAFDVMALATFEAYTNKQNAPSIHLLKKSDFTYVKTITEQHSPEHEPAEMVVYAMQA